MANFEWVPAVYSAPEAVEVGDARELTLGGGNCGEDSCSCKKCC